MDKSKVPRFLAYFVCSCNHGLRGDLIYCQRLRHLPYANKSLIIIVVVIVVVLSSTP